MVKLVLDPTIVFSLATGGDFVDAVLFGLAFSSWGGMGWSCLVGLVLGGHCDWACLVWSVLVVTSVFSSATGITSAGTGLFSLAMSSGDVVGAADSANPTVVTVIGFSSVFLWVWGIFGGAAVLFSSASTDFALAALYLGLVSGAKGLVFAGSSVPPASRG